MAQRRYSKQRELIYETLLHSTDHPSAEMIHQWLKPTIPSLSLGTVYRNLNLLVEEGRAVQIPWHINRFDAKLQPHAHFVCHACGCIDDLEVVLPEVCHEAVANLGYEVQREALMFSGLCAHCLAKSKQH